MKRTLVTAAVTAACAALAPAGAAAAIVEIGATATPLVAPTCPTGVSPANCTIVLTRVTALQTVRDRVAYPTMVVRPGRIVAFTLGLSGLSASRATAKQDIHLLDTAYGGTTRVALTILRPAARLSLHRFKVVAESPVFRVQPYLGQVVQFALTSSLPVRRGDLIALTTPTWAPVLSIDLSSTRFAYRQSRTSACNAPPVFTQAQLVIGDTGTYACKYPGTRVEYTATEVTDPVAVNPIHARDLRR